MGENLVALSLLSGGAAGTVTDLVFYPIDTVRTRLQAKGGFFNNGGWRDIYKGVSSPIIASAPAASLFFLSYELSKSYLAPYHVVGNKMVNDGLIHMFGATVGEIAACSVRVPSEVIKQRVQTAQHASTWHALRSILKNDHGEGIWLGLYRGWGTTIMREIPFTMIQFPLYEYCKQKWADKTDRPRVTPEEGAVCGAFAGGVAGALTNPLDVLKTRLMLSKNRVSVGTLLTTILKEEGYRALLRGIGPRIMWLSAGGAVFLGVYEVARDSFGFVLDGHLEA